MAHLALEPWLGVERQVSTREHGRQGVRDTGGDHEKGGGADKAYRHAYVGVASSALMRWRVAHVHGELGVPGHGATLWPVVVVIPPMKTAVVALHTRAAASKKPAAASLTM